MQQGLPTHQPLTARFTHESAPIRMRMQVALLVRDKARRVACVRTEETGDEWALPVEMLQVNEDPAAAAERVARTWFASPLRPRFSGFLNFPSTGPADDKWYLLFAFEADAPAALAGTPDTVEVRFAEPGKAPGPFAMSHEDVWARLGK